MGREQGAGRWGQAESWRKPASVVVDSNRNHASRPFFEKVLDGSCMTHCLSPFLLWPRCLGPLRLENGKGLAGVWSWGDTLLSSELGGRCVGGDSEQSPCQGRCELCLVDSCYLETACENSSSLSVHRMRRLYSNVAKFLAPLIRGSLTFHVPNNKHGWLVAAAHGLGLLASPDISPGSPRVI